MQCFSQRWTYSVLRWMSFWGNSSPWKVCRFGHFPPRCQPCNSFNSLVLLSRTSSSMYQPPLANFPPGPVMTPAAPPPTHHTAAIQQQQPQILSPQMTPTVSPLTGPPANMGVTPLTNFIGEAPSTVFSPFSPPPPPIQTYLPPPQEQRLYNDSNDVTPTHTPPPQPPEAQFSMPPDGMGQSSMFQFPIKRDTSSESPQRGFKSPQGGFKSPQGGFMSPPIGGRNSITNSNYDPRAQSNYSNILLTSGQPLSSVTMDTQQLPADSHGALQQSMGGALGSVAPPYDASLGPGGVAEGGDILGSKRKEVSLQYLHGTKRRSPYSSQNDLPLWSDEGFSSSPAMPPPPVPLSARRASIGSATQLNERPILQKNKSEPSGSIQLKVYFTLHVCFFVYSGTSYQITALWGQK